LTTFKIHTNRGLWIGAQVLVGIGRGCGFQMPLLAVQSNFSPAEATIGTSLVIFSQYFGGAVFSSVSETILISSLVKNLPVYAPGTNVQKIIDAGGAGVWKVVAGADLQGVLTAYNEALTHVFVWSLSNDLQETETMLTFCHSIWLLRWPLQVSFLAGQWGRRE
jgi:hypothetical protein